MVAAFYKKSSKLVTYVKNFALLLVIGILVSACTEKNIYANLTSKSYISDQQEIIEAADWQMANTFEVRIRQNEFRPAIIRLKQGEPYIMLIENRDDITHILVAEEFFRTIAIRKILSQTMEITKVNLIGLPTFMDPIKKKLEKVKIYNSILIHLSLIHI